MTTEEKFEMFGPKLQNKKCAVCDEIDTRMEPRFGYYVCINHFEVSPIDIISPVDTSRIGCPED